MTGFGPDYRMSDQLSAMFKHQFFFNSFPVGTDGFDTDAQLNGDVFGRHAQTDKLENFKFPVRQPF